MEKNKNLKIAALFHDIGKPLTYSVDENGIGHFYNHWNKSIEIFKLYENKFKLTEEDKTLIKNLIFYHDMNLEKKTNEQTLEIIKNIGNDNIDLLFKLKRADLLAQSQEFHYLLKNIYNQEKEIKKLIYKNKEYL